MDRIKNLILKENKVKIIAAAIGAVALIISALIMITPQLFFNKNSLTNNLRIDHSSMAEKQIEPKRFNRFNTYDLSLAWYEPFNGIQPGWDLSHFNFLENGELHMFHNYPNSEVHTCINFYYALGLKSYQVEVNCGQLSGPIWSFGIVLRVVGKDNYLFFSYRRDGKFRVSNFQNNQWYDYFDWQQNVYDPNSKKVHLTIRNSEEDFMEGTRASITKKELIFSINGNVVATIKNNWENEYLNVGFFSTFDMHVVFDDFTVREYPSRADF